MQKHSVTFPAVFCQVATIRQRMPRLGSASRPDGSRSLFFFCHHVLFKIVGIVPTRLVNTGFLVPQVVALSSLSMFLDVKCPSLVCKL